MLSVATELLKGVARAVCRAVASASETRGEVVRRVQDLGYAMRQYGSCSFSIEHLAYATRSWSRVEFEDFCKHALSDGRPDSVLSVDKISAHYADTWQRKFV